MAQGLGTNHVKGIIPWKIFPTWIRRPLPLFRGKTILHLVVKLRGML